MYREASTLNDDGDRAQLAKWATRSEAATRIRAMLELAKSEPEIVGDTEEFDRAPMLLNVQNGTLDLETGELRAHDPVDMLTRVADVVYKPGATCTRWEAFVDEIMEGDADMVAYIQRAMGYSLTGLTQEQCLFFPYGIGANGKSTLLETFIKLLGDYATKTRTETLLLKRYDGGPNNDVAALAGARLVVAAEIPGNRHLNENLVKDLTGGDTITARFLRKEFFEFKPTFKLWMYGNHKPQITGTDDGIWRRLHLVPFTVQIPEAKRDKTLPVKLLSELPGIFNWVLGGLEAWKKDGLRPPQKVMDATNDYRAEMDVMQAFLEECCNLGPTHFVVFADLYDVYKAWAANSGEKTETKRKFTRLLTEKGLDSYNGTGNVTMKRGVSLKPAYTP
jgi:putative DNA primase/helicase